MLNPSDTKKVQSSLYQARVPKAINRLMQLANIMNAIPGREVIGFDFWIHIERFKHTH
jgi:hypothetical protein